MSVGVEPELLLLVLLAPPLVLPVDDVAPDELVDELLVDPDEGSSSLHACAATSARTQANGPTMIDRFMSAIQSHAIRRSPINNP